MLSACASFIVQLETPEVKVVSLRMLPASSNSGLAQQLAIGLRVSNPNATTLNLVGMKYSLKVQGFDLLSGVSNDIPPIEGYAETQFEVIASVNLINSLRLFQSLLSNPEAPVKYQLNAKLDPGPLLPAFHVVEAGEIALGQ